MPMSPAMQQALDSRTGQGGGGGGAPVGPPPVSMSPAMSASLARVAPTPAAPPVRIPGQGKAAAPAKKGGGGIGGFLAHIGHAGKSVAEGLAGFGKDTGSLLLHAGENVVNDVSGSHLGPVADWRSGGILPSQNQITQTLNEHPSYRGAVQGLKQSGNEIVHPTQIARNYSANPGQALLNDVSNIALVAPGAGEALKAATLGRVAEAGRAGSLGAAGEKVVAVTDAATHPVRALGSKAMGAATKDYGEGVKPSAGSSILANMGARLDRAPAAVKNAILGGNASKGLAAADNAQLAAKALKESGIKDPAEAEAFLAVHEGVAPTLDKAIGSGGATGGQMSDEELAHYLDAHNLNITPEGARKAVAAFRGEDPESAARIQKAMEVFDQGLGTAGRGSLAARNEAYVAEHPWQAGYQANPIGVDQAVEKPARLANKAADVASKARARANADADLLSRARAERAGHLLLGPDGEPLAVHPMEAPVSRLQGRIQSEADRAGLLREDAQARADAMSEAPLPTRNPEAADQMRHAVARVEMGNEAAARAFDRGAGATLNVRGRAGEQEARFQRQVGRLLRPGTEGDLKAAKAEASARADAERMAARQGRATDQFGRSAERVGDRMMRTGNVLGHLEQRAAGSEAKATHLERRASMLRENVRASKNRAEYDLTNAPSHLRPALQAARDAEQHLTGVANGLRGQGLHAAADRVEQEIAGLPTTLDKLQGSVESGQMAEPRYFPHIQEGPPTISVGGRKMTAGSEKLRKGSQSYMRTFGAIAKGLTSADAAKINRDMVDEIVNHPDVGAAYLGKGALKDVHTVEDAAKLGYVPFKPETAFGTGPTKIAEMDAKLGLSDQPFVKKPVLDQFNRYTAPPKGQALRLATGVPNRLWVLGRLVATPALETGRIFGHTMLRSARENPVEIYRSTRAAYRMWKDSGEGARLKEIAGGHGERTFDVHPRVLKAGSLRSEIDRLEAEKAAGPSSGVRGAVNKVNRVLTSATEKPMNFAHWWDDLNRSAQYLTEHARLVKQGADAAAQSTAEQAAKAALRVTGAFDDLSPFERDYVRQAVPFWAWHRAITRIVFQLAVDHPLRVAWTLHLADIARQANGDDQLPDFLQGNIPIGHSLLNAGLAFPFGEVGSAFGGGSLGVGKVLGPEGRLLLGNLPGHAANPSTGNPWYMPPGTPPGHGPSILSQVANFFPQTRLVSGLRGKDTVQRYANGEPVLPKTAGYRPVPTGTDRTQSLLGFAGLGVTNRDLALEHAAESQKKAAKTQRTQSKQSLLQRAREQRATRAGLLP